MAAHAAPLAKPKAPKPGRDLNVQARLAVGAVHDHFEHEADRIADGVTRGTPMPAAAPPPVISGVTAMRAPAPTLPGPEQTDETERPEKRAQRSMGGNGALPTPTANPKPDEKPTKAQRDPSASATTISPAGGTAPAAVEARIERERQRPAPGLDPATRTTIERHVGADLGGVRVHNDSAAGEAAEALNARAFTVGQDVFFARGQYDPHSTAGRHLIAHEVAHTVQQRGGSAGAQRVQRKEGEIKVPDAAPIDRIEPANAKEGWAIDLNEVGTYPGTVMVPKLELPKVGGALKGTDATIAEAAKEPGRTLPVEGAPFTLNPTSKRESGKVFEMWVEYARKEFSPDIKTVLETKIAQQKPKAEPLDRKGKDVYVLYGGGKQAAKADTMFVGDTEELSRHDSLVRPMIGPEGGANLLDADHSLELQLGGLDGPTNLWLLQRDFNQTVGPAIQGKMNSSITAALKAAQERLKATKATPRKKLPENHTEVLRQWVVVFGTVIGSKDFGSTRTMWTRQQIKAGEHVKYFKAMTATELVQQGFAFKDGETPKQVNVFPSASGGRVSRFGVSKDGKKLKKPAFFYRGFEVIEDADYRVPTAATKNQPMATLRVRRKKKKERGSDIIVFFDADLKLQHDEALGFGGYITDESRYAAFKGVIFKPLCPIDFTDVQVTAEGDFVAIGTILPELALFPGLKVPIVLRGDDILIAFPIPTDKLNFGPVKVTNAALEMGVGAKGFFIQGSAGIAIDRVGAGTLTARGENESIVFGGIFDLELDFLDKAQVKVSYNVSTDEFTGSAELKTRKDALPGVRSGTVMVTVSRDSFGLIGSLELDGLLAGSTITVGYTPSTGLLIEGKDLPLPVDKLPGVSDAKVTVRAVRDVDSGEWTISGGGKAALSAAGASATLDILFDGHAVTFKGRADVKKGPASGWLDITATNRTVDESGNPVDGAPVGELRIWGKGQATIKFGKVLRGTAAIEYTPEGHVILAGEIALPPTFNLFPRVDYKKTLLDLHPPDFPIWGVKVGPVGIGIFAFVDASVIFNAHVGPGQLRDTKVSATMDLDKPEEATVAGTAQFFVPAFAGFTLDLGGGLKAQVAVAYVKGRVGLDGTLGVALDGAIDVGVNWNQADGFAVGGRVALKARPKFELGVNASVSAGVDVGLFDIEKEWGPWRKKLGEFGPDLELEVAFPMRWSEKSGLDLSLDNIEVKKPQLDAVDLMKGAFDVLV